MWGCFIFHYCAAAYQSDKRNGQWRNKQIIKTGIIPPLLVTLTISIVYLIMVRVLYNLEDLPVKKVPAWTKICLEIILLIALVGTIQVQGTKVGMWEYIKSV